MTGWAISLAFACEMALILHLRRMIQSHHVNTKILV